MPAENVRSRVWTLAHGRSLELGSQSVLMGILNVTPDSFSDGGAYRGDVSRAVDAALRMIEEGAAIIDIGGESTRPGAEPVEAEEERRRVLPVIEALASRSDCLISIDTYRSETARAAVQTGAHIVNDVWGAQRDPAIAEVAATTGAGLCLMHTGRERVRGSDVIADQFQFLETSLRIAADAGVSTAQIVLDPGFGFGKDAAENINLMMRLDELKASDTRFWSARPVSVSCARPWVMAKPTRMSQRLRPAFSCGSEAPPSSAFTGSVRTGMHWLWWTQGFTPWRWPNDEVCLDRSGWKSR